MTPSRTSRFWIVGIVLIFGSVASVVAQHFVLKERPSVADLVFHGVIFLAGLSLLDRETASSILSTIKFWKRNGTTPPSETDGDTSGTE